jgi:flagellar P-ring protein precursor FlgI
MAGAVKRLAALLLAIASTALPVAARMPGDGDVRIKDLGRLAGWRDNALSGYGIVTGLAGTGDTARNQATRQSLASILQNFDVKITPDQIASRNAAVVMVTASLPPYARKGATIDVTVTSMGDARSLLGGTLLLAPLKGADGRVYGLAQGAVSIGGYRYDMNGNVVQKNHPTTGTIPAGATVEVLVDADILTPQKRMNFVLNSPDHTTASRIAAAINEGFGMTLARAVSAAEVELTPSEAQLRDIVSLMTRLERLSVQPDQQARVVINERTGVIVSGGDARISRVSISHGELKVSITTENFVSQPSGLVLGRSDGIRTEGYANSKVEVTEDGGKGFVADGHNTVTELVSALSRMKVSTRDMIAILQAIKGAGALHAELLIQ